MPIMLDAVIFYKPYTQKSIQGIVKRLIFIFYYYSIKWNFRWAANSSCHKNIMAKPQHMTLK